MKIENHNTLLQCLKNGVNLFLGSGFSVLSEDINGRHLPTGAGLKSELLHEFKQIDAESLTLAQLCSVIASENNEALTSYLSRRFTVSRYSKEYLSIRSINVSRIYTTNIDDLCEHIYRDSPTSYLNNVRTNGPKPYDRNAINYYPLHGSVNLPDDSLVFSPTDLAAAFNNNSDEWGSLVDVLSSQACVFLGYSFEDPGLLNALETVKRKSKKVSLRVWALVYNETEARKKYLRSLGVGVIEGGTLDFLEYITRNENAIINKSSPTSGWNGMGFEDLMIPKISSVPARKAVDFYTGAGPAWDDILRARVPYLSHYKILLEMIGGKNNVYVSGIPASGKTTLMMQVAVGATNLYPEKVVLLTSTLSAERARLLIERLRGFSAIVLIDNYADSSAAIQELNTASNIRLLCFEHTYSHEMIRHRLPTKGWLHYDISSLTEQDVQLVYSAIPETIRAKRLTNRQAYCSTESVFEVVQAHTNIIRLSERFRALLDRINAEDQDLHDLIVMVAYTHSCRTPVSMDMIYAFHGGYSNHEAITSRLHNARDLIVEVGELLELSDQDYFYPRSTLFANAVLDQVVPARLGRMLRNFHSRIRPSVIPDYRVFQRLAFDAKTVGRAFPNWKEGQSFYDECIKRNENPYIKQQAALYLDDRGRLNESFDYIERAVRGTRSPIWTISNTYAVIVFKVNIDRDGPGVRESLDESMKILSNCYDKDARKPYHILTYGRQAISYLRRYNDSLAQQYVRTAAERVDVTLRDPSVYLFRRELLDLQNQLKEYC
jgi:hypothetical protein